MRNISIEDFAEHADQFVAELEAGHSLTLVRAGHPVAEVVPFPQAPVPTREERDAAWKRLQELFDNAKPLGIQWNGRDELYDRD